MGHKRWTICGFHFCSVCGAHAYHFPAPKLLKLCKAVPEKSRDHHLRRHLKLMHAGQHPESKRFIGVARRCFASSAQAESDGSYGRLARARIQDNRCTDARPPKKCRVSNNNISPADLASQVGPSRSGSNSSRHTAADSLPCDTPAPKRRRSDHRTDIDHG